MIRAASLAICLAFFVGPASALDPDPGVRFSDKAITKVSARAERNVEYDRATVEIGMLVTGDSPDEVAKLLADKLTPLVTALRKLVANDKALRSYGPSIGDRYDIVRNAQGQEIYEKRKRIGSEGSYYIYVELTELDRVSEAVKLSTDFGGVVRRIVFATSIERSVRQTLREEAVRKGVAEAKRLTEAAGARLGRILEIRDLDTAEYADLAVSSGPGTTYIPILPGTNNVIVKVQIWAEINSPKLSSGSAPLKKSSAGR